jgi:hypothetical protein
MCSVYVYTHVWCMYNIILMYGVYTILYSCMVYVQYCTHVWCMYNTLLMYGVCIYSCIVYNYHTHGGDCGSMFVLSMMGLIREHVVIMSDHNLTSY